MKTGMEAPRAVELDHSRFSKFIVRSAAAMLGMLLLAAA
jgi:hypothetical protein